jgi:hypothetical protein
LNFTCFIPCSNAFLSVLSLSNAVSSVLNLACETVSNLIAFTFLFIICFAISKFTDFLGSNKEFKADN